jgi:hypothetical protein
VSLSDHQRWAAGRFCFEPDGYITFYTVDQKGCDGEAHGSIPGLRKYRARFLSGQLQDIVSVSGDSVDHVRYGLASFRWFEPRSFMFGDPDETADADKTDIEFGK